MNKRTVLSFDPLQNDFYAKIVRSSVLVPLEETTGVVRLDPDHLPAYTTEAAVLGRGKMVRDALRAHQGIRKVLENLSTVPPDEVHPLFIMLGISRAERINWEMLCDTNDSFVALDQRWPIARIIDPVNAKPQPPCEFASPVKVLAVISALGVRDQENEWKQLFNALKSARGNGLPVELKIFTGEPALFQSIEHASKSTGGIEVETIPPTPSQLTQAIRLWAPHIMHFFCHGYAGADGQWLELATATDYLKPPGNASVTTGSVCISTKELATLGSSLKNTWLMVLNCCSGGHASDGLQSMANQIVSAGIPAVIAMMEPVTSRNAYDFTEAFYPDAMQSLIAVQEELKTRSNTMIEWTTLMFQVRQVIAQKSGQNHKSKEWSLPMLYVRGIDPQMFIRPVETDQKKLDEYHLRLKTAAMWLRTAGQHLNPTERTEALEKGLDGVPRDLWPDLEGEFPYASQ